MAGLLAHPLALLALVAGLLDPAVLGEPVHLDPAPLARRGDDAHLHLY